MTRIAHLSDLHFGTEDPQVCAALRRTLAGQAPDLVAVSGDLTQRARRHQFRAAREFLVSLPGELLVVPGNHDVPLFDLATRAFRPYRNYQKIFGDRQAEAVSAGSVTLLGVDSTRPWRHKEGWLGRRGNRSIPLRLPTRASESVLGMVTHHPLQKNGAAGKQKTSQSVQQMVSRLYGLGVDFILCGHDHHARSHWFDLADTGNGAPKHGEQGILQISAGTTVSTRVREHPNSFNLLRVHTTAGQRPVLVNERWDYQQTRGQFVCMGDEPVALSRRS